MRERAGSSTAAADVLGCNPSPIVNTSIKTDPARLRAPELSCRQEAEGALHKVVLQHGCTTNN